MKAKWLALATATALTAVPCLAQSDMSMSTGTQDTTMSGGGMSGGMTYTNVDTSKVRDNLDRLRGYVNRMRENTRLANASPDFVQADSFRRSNEILLDNASSLAINVLEMLGPPANIPPGLGEARDHVEMVVNHLAHARLMSDYSVPIEQTKTHLDMVYQAMDRGSQNMSGGSMSSGGMSGGSMGGMSGGSMGGMSGGSMSGGNTGSMSGGTTGGNNTTDPTQNQSNPGLNNYNNQNNAGTGVGDVTTTPNTTPGETPNPGGTGDAGTGNPS